MAATVLIDGHLLGVAASFEVEHTAPVEMAERVRIKFRLCSVCESYQDFVDKNYTDTFEALIRSELSPRGSLRAPRCRKIRPRKHRRGGLPAMLQGVPIVVDGEDPRDVELEAIPVEIGNSFVWYILDAITTAIPNHLDHAEVNAWESAIRSNPATVPIYADWCDEQGWSERAEALRGLAGRASPIHYTEQGAHRECHRYG